MPSQMPGSDRPLTIQVERREQAAVVRFSGACTMEVSSQVRHCLVGLTHEKIPLIVLDLSELDFIDSTGLGGIVAAHLKARHHHGVIRMVGLKAPIRELLTVTRLCQLFSEYPDVERALEDRPN